MNEYDTASNVEERVAKLEKDFASLQQSTSIPLDTKRAFMGVGFLTETEFITAGSGTFAVTGDYALLIPGATSNSIILASPGTGAVQFISAQMRPSPTATNQYEIYLEGTAGDTFFFIVFNLKNKPYVSN